MSYILLVVDTQSLTHFFRFRWVVCQFDMPQNCINPFMMEEALRNLPPTLDKTYERILESIHESHQKYAQKLLQWLSFSARPLQIKELAEVLVIDLVEEQLIYDTKYRLRNPRDILAICSCLINIPTSDDGEIQLAHFSVREYLISTRIPERLAPFFSFNETSANIMIAQTCLAYLLHFDTDEFDFSGGDTTYGFDSDTTDESDFGPRSGDRSPGPRDSESFPLSRYAARFWVGHALGDGAASNHMLQLQILDLLESHIQFLHWIQIHNHFRRFESGRYTVGHPLYLASFLGLSQAVLLLLKKGHSVNEVVGNLGSALQAASYRGSQTSVQILLDHGADVNFNGGFYRSALQAACYQGFEPIVCLLLAKGALVDGGQLNRSVPRWHRYDRDHNTSPLQEASFHGWKSIVELLLENGADVNLKGGYWGSAINATLARANLNEDALRLSLLRLLLENRADVNLVGGNGKSALQTASAHGFESAVRLLLENGADVNLKGNDGSSALYNAAWRNQLTVVQLLLDNDADVNLVGGDYGSALQASSSRGYVSVVEVLLRHGADVNIAGGMYGSALQAASMSGSDSIVQVLLDHGADVNMCGGTYGSALIAASAFGGHLSAVQLLLKHGADVNFKPGGEKCGSALHEASRYAGYEKTSRLTLDVPALQREEVDFARRPASATDADLIVQVLLEHGADVNMRGGEYGTALQAASQCGHRPTVQRLLDHGAEVNIKGGKYGSALNAAASRRLKSIVKLLRDHGADEHITCQRRVD